MVQKKYKVYMLIDIDTDRVCFNSEVVVNEEVGTFQNYPNF